MFGAMSNDGGPSRRNTHGSCGKTTARANTPMLLLHGVLSRIMAELHEMCLASVGCAVPHNYTTTTFTTHTFYGVLFTNRRQLIQPCYNAAARMTAAAGRPGLAYADATTRYQRAHYLHG